MKFAKKARRLTILVCLAALLLLTASCKKFGGRLTRAELDQVTAAMADYIETGEGRVFNNAVNAYHPALSDYDKPQDLPLAAFLAHFQTEEYLTDTDAEEFYALTALPRWEGSAWNEEENRPLLPGDLPMSVRRIPEDQVNAVLNQWLGMGWREMEDLDGTLYLPEYRAFYTFASDPIASDFLCVKGEWRLDTLWLWSQATTRDLPEGPAEQCRRLTLKRAEDHWFIEALHWVDPVE